MTEQSTQHPDQSSAPVPPDFRALCAELHEALEAKDLTLADDRLLDRSAAALRAALAEPVPPIDGEVAELVVWLGQLSEMACTTEDANRLDRIIALLQQRHPTPVPVSERLPGPAAAGEVAA